jgi:glycosyltransferase involved in cell wall biosynthesis
MRFSVVIPAFNEAAHIERVVEAVQAQILEEGDSLEIIVVDNNSEDGTAAAARARLGENGKVILEKQPGPNFARQCGFLESTGDVICFIDSDCSIPQDWVRNIRSEIEKGAIAVSGPYYYGFAWGYQNWLNKFYVSVVLPAIPFVLEALFRRRAAVIIGGNFAATREALRMIGGIPPVEFWGDDAMIAMMLARRVGKVKFSMKVWAQTSPRRYDEKGFWRLTYKYAMAYFRAFFAKDTTSAADSIRTGD